MDLFLSGRGNVGSYLERLKFIENPECIKCHQERETVAHAISDVSNGMNSGTNQK